MDLNRLFDEMEAAGIGRPKDEKDFHRHGPWHSLSVAVIQGKSENIILGKIPWVAKAMGIVRKENAAMNAAMVREAAEKARLRAEWKREKRGDAPVDY